VSAIPKINNCSCYVSVSLFSCYLSLSYFPHSLLALSMAIPQHIINNSWIFSTVYEIDRSYSRGSVRWLVQPTAYRRIRLVSTTLNKCFQQDNAVSSIDLLSYFNITSFLDMYTFLYSEIQDDSVRWGHELMIVNHEIVCQWKRKDNCATEDVKVGFPLPG
jgi:hypothetical protein